MRTREELSALIEGRLASPAGRSALVELATRLIVEEALEGEAQDTLGRDYYEHGAVPGQGYRNGTRPGRLKTAEGNMTYSGAADFWPGPTLSLGDPGASEGSDGSSGKLGGRDAGTRSVGARYRGCVSGRERPPLAVQDGGGRDGRAALAGLSGLQEPGSRRIRDRLSVHRRHRRATASRPEAGAGAGGLGASPWMAARSSCI